VLAVVAVLLVVLVESIIDHGGDSLLSVVQMHETANVALHVCLVARILEKTRELHHSIALQKILLAATRDIQKLVAEKTNIA
jgi:hypothetical protein